MKTKPWPADALPVSALVALCVAYWSRVLFTAEVLLPGRMLSGFAPFGSRPDAPWTILQWDALAQYYPWRVFAARQLHHGLIPLWNPHQFAGTPFVANLQSAVFYPLNLPFWCFGVAHAFGISAALHSLLASLSLYFLARRWGLGRGAATGSAVAFGYCGYLAAWVMLPTLSNTASWLPLLILMLERAAARWEPRGVVYLGLGLGTALLAGHAQIFIYLLMALGLRALLLPRPLRSLCCLAAASSLSVALVALQVLPTLELARLGHRAAQGGASAAGWGFVQQNALNAADLPSLLIAGWPMAHGSWNENFPYIGAATALLAVLGTVFAGRRLRRPGAGAAGPALYLFVMAAFGVLYAMATPLAQIFYFGIPPLAQMGGTGRALLLFSLGAAGLAGLGLQWVRQRSGSAAATGLAIVAVAAELWWSGPPAHPTAPRASIYPQTTLTTWLQGHLRPGERLLCLTPGRGWLPAELRRQLPHPAGVLPPNGATVYGLDDVNGYDSLAPLAYRQFVAQGDSEISPPFNGNMILLRNVESSALDALNVRYVVSSMPVASPRVHEVLRADSCMVYARTVANAPRVSGRDFYPGWSNVYQPESFRFGVFISLCGLALAGALLAATAPLNRLSTTPDRDPGSA